MSKVSSLNKAEEERASALHEKAIIINMLDSTTGGFERKYCEKLVEAGITTINTTANQNIAFRPYEGLPEVLREFYKWHKKIQENSDKLTHCTKVTNIMDAKKNGKTAVILGFQDPKPIDQDLDLLLVFYKLGLRICGLAYFRRNAFADGCGEKTDCGLSKIGEMAVGHMNKLGVLIDLSHCQYTASMEAIALSKDPVVFSHSNPRAAYDHLRNLTDEQIKACAEKGGVIGVTAFSTFLRPKGAIVGATIEDCLNHIDYIAKLVGVDHVGIGMDMAEGRTVEEVMLLARAYPELSKKQVKIDESAISKRYALRTILEFQNYTRGLVAMGYSDQEILKILGGNFLRVFERVWC